MYRYFDLLIRYFGQFVKVRMAYKIDFFVSIATTLVATMFGLALVFLLFQRAPEVAGWIFPEILFLYGFGLIPLSLFNLLSVNLYYFGEVYIIEGKFDRVLLRPVNSLFQVMSEQFNLQSIADTLIGLAIVVYSSRILGLEYGLADWIFLGFAAICGLVIYISVFLMLTCVSFWVEDRVGVIPPVYNMLAFGRYPLPIYGQVIQFILSWLVPFGFAAFYPASKLLGRTEHLSYVLYLPFVTVSFLLLALFLWSRGVRNYSSTGS